jgi:hypothetical protein
MKIVMAGDKGKLEYEDTKEELKSGSTVNCVIRK